LSDFYLYKNHIFIMVFNLHLVHTLRLGFIKAVVHILFIVFRISKVHIVNLVFIINLIHMNGLVFSMHLINFYICRTHIVFEHLMLTQDQNHRMFHYSLQVSYVSYSGQLLFLLVFLFCIVAFSDVSDLS